MNTNLFARFGKVGLLVLVAIATIASLAMPVAAAPAAAEYPLCGFGPLNAVGPAPLAVHFDASASRNTVSYAWFTADGNSSGVGSTFDHTFASIGTHTVRLTVYSAQGTYNSCTTHVDVKAPAAVIPTSAPVIVTPMPLTATPTSTPLPTVIVPTSTSVPSTRVVPNIDDSGNASGNKSKTEGDNSPAININGDSNKVIIKVEQPAQVLPAPTAQAPLVCPTPSDGETVICSRGDLVLRTPPPQSSGWDNFWNAVADWVKKQH
jgi:PKD repeat protein